MIAVNWSDWARQWWELAQAGLFQGIVSAVMVGGLLWALRRRTTARFRYLMLMLLFVKIAAPPLPGWGLFPSFWSHAPRISFDPLVEQSSVQNTLEEPRSNPAETFDNTPSLEHPTPPAVVWSWKTVGMIAHLTGTVVLLTVLAGVHAKHWWTMRHRGTRIDGGPWHDDLLRLQKRLRVQSRVELWSLPDLGSPVACGIFTQRILLPRWTLDIGTEQRAAILGHELAHIRHWDTWMVWIENLSLACQWWNPLAHILRTRLRNEREQLCDSLVLHEGICSPSHYANTLLDALTHLGVRQQLHFGTELTGNARRFSQRLEAIMSGTMPRESRLGYAGLTVVLVTAALLLPGVPLSHHFPASLANANAREEKQTPMPKAETVLSEKQKLERMLQSSVSVEFHETPLQDAVRFFRELAGIKIVLDQNGLDIAKIKPDVPITLRLESVPLWSALRLCLLEYNLTLEVQGDIVLITDGPKKDREDAKRKAKSESQIKVERALQLPTRLDFHQTPLSNVVGFLRDLTGANIVIDRKGLAEAKIDLDVPITFHSDGKKVSDVLEEILSPLGLEAAIRHDVLLITNKGKPRE